MQKSCAETQAIDPPENAPKRSDGEFDGASGTDTFSQMIPAVGSAPCLPEEDISPQAENVQEPAWCAAWVYAVFSTI